MSATQELPYYKALVIHIETIVNLEEARRVAELIKSMEITQGFEALKNAWRLVMIRFMNSNDWFEVCIALDNKREAARKRLCEADPRMGMKLLDAIADPAFGISTEEAESVKPSLLLHSCPLVKFPVYFQTYFTHNIDEPMMAILRRVMCHVGLELDMDI